MTQASRGTLLSSRSALPLLLFSAWLLPGTGRSANLELEPFHVQAERVVFRLEHLESISRPGEPKPKTIRRSDGTAFVIQHQGHFYLVTARHVADTGYDLQARVPSRHSETGATDVVELHIPRGAWVFHEVGPELKIENGVAVRLHGVDVAVCPLPGIKDRTVVKFLSCTECPSGEMNQLSTSDPVPPTAILIAGFPGELGFAVLEQRPLFRAGIVALVPGSRVLSLDGGAYADDRCVVLDARAEPGNSGSPVFTMSPFNGAISLAGVLIASNITTNICVVEPASRVRETLDRAEQRSPATTPTWNPIEP